MRLFRFPVAVCLFTAIIFCFIPPSVAVEDGDRSQIWHDMGVYGGQILSLAVDPQQPWILYAGTWCGDGLFKSSDSGASWTTLPDEATARFRNFEVFDIALDPSDPSTIWVANKQQIDVSTDAGHSWRTCIVAPNRFVYSLAVDPHDSSGNTVYAGTSGLGGAEIFGALYRTQDGGIHWELLLSAPYDILDVTVSTHSEGRLWVVSAPWSEPEGCVGYVFRSDDAGISWASEHRAVLPDGTRSCFGYLDEIIELDDSSATVLACGKGGIVWCEPDGSSNAAWRWSLFYPAITVNALCLGPGSPEILYCSATDGVRTSGNKGFTWSDPLPAPLFLCMHADPRNPGSVYGGSSNRGVFSSSDFGLTWRFSGQGIRANTVYDVAVSLSDPTRIACATLAGLFQKNGSGGWTLINDRSSYAVVYHPCNDSILYAGFDNMLGKSTDGGRTWTYCVVADSSFPHDITALAFSGSRFDVIFAAVGFDAGNRGYIVRVADNGTSLSDASSAVVLTTDVPVNTIVTHPDRPSLMFAGSGWFYAPGVPGAIHLSTDGGRHWHEGSLRNVVVNAIALSPDDPCTVFAACGDSGNRWGGLYKSTDCGITWSPASAGLPSSFSAVDVAVDPARPDIVYGGLYDGEPNSGMPASGVYISLTAGSYWTQLGLSEYALHCIGHIPFSAHIQGRCDLKAKGPAYPSATIIAGTESGLFSSTTTGCGIITGTVTSKGSGAPIDGAVVASDVGVHCMSSAGFYCLVLPAGSHSLTVSAPGFLSQATPELHVQSGETLEYGLCLSPVAGDNGTVCLAEKLFEYDRNAQVIHALRLFRDRILSRSQSGRLLISLYYEYGEGIWNLIRNDDRLAQECRELVLQVAAAISSDQSTLTQNIELVNKASFLLGEIERKMILQRAHRCRGFEKEILSLIRDSLKDIRPLPKPESFEVATP